MSDAPAASNAPFDLERLQQLIELMEKHGLSEVSLRRGPEQWRLRRGVTAPVMASVPMMAAPPPMQQAAPIAPMSSATPAAPKDDGLLTIKAPTVGTFYASQTPEDPPFVTIGAKVTPQTTVCLIEAMKVFNPIPSEVAGTITEVLVKNGDAVEYGQALFKVRP
ncbi:MAG TPA: acetyl-CoA carboxylase biotin carboxyl carrier protein [Planctomycetaceae bacterium]|nr:acetyl-CoA carboxylase biotin carboxyl carrier protein [Planctomycetaceae bacterium]